MQYRIEISHTTGRIIEEKGFAELDEARLYFEEIVQTTLLKRVLITLMHCPGPGEEYMLDVDFMEGVSLNPLYPPPIPSMALQPAADKKSDQP
jgi:hypothetical protein